MKYFLFVFFILSSLFSFSQVPGLVSENNVLKVTYGQYQENQYHRFIVENKRSCSVNILIDDGKTTTIVSKDIVPNGVLEYKLYAPKDKNVKFRAKLNRGGECEPEPNYGWVETSSYGYLLPITFTNVNFYAWNNRFNVDFTFEKVITPSYFIIMISKDGRNFKVLKDRLMTNHYDFDKQEIEKILK